jgi:hypothetical protein
MGRPQYEVADVFRLAGQAYRSGHKLNNEQYKAMRAIEQCRTAALGGHVDVCDECGHVRTSYNSCRNRHCPKCQSLAREAWLEARRADLLPVGYFHVVFTLPAELRNVVRYNERLLYGTLFREAWEALSGLCTDRRYLGARTGMVAVLHTWGQNLHYHPHVHCIVPGGGLSGGKWVPARKGFLVPVRALSAMFKGKFVSALRRHYQAGHLRLDGLCAHLRGRQAFSRLLKNLMAEDWVVYSKPPFAGPGRLLAYLGRYTHRVAISNHRIVSLDKDTVCFRWRDYAGGNLQKVMRLGHEEFIRRFLQHVLPAGFCKIRYYGILSNRLRKQSLGLCRRALGVKPPPHLPTLPWQERYRQATGMDWDTCPVCGKGRMLTVLWVTAGRGPPCCFTDEVLPTLLPAAQRASALS